MRCGLDRSDRPRQPVPLGDVLLVPTSDPGWLLTEDGVDIAVIAVESLPRRKDLARRSRPTLEACVKVTPPGETTSNVGYHGTGDDLKIPRAEWGVG